MVLRRRSGLEEDASCDTLQTRSPRTRSAALPMWRVRALTQHTALIQGHPAKCRIKQSRGDQANCHLRISRYRECAATRWVVADAGVFAVLENNQSVTIYQVERVYQSGPGRIRCTPRNPAYTPFELTLGKDASHRARCPKDHPVPVRDANAAAGAARRLFLIIVIAELTALAPGAQP
jgi:hypothetical protein